MDREKVIKALEYCKDNQHVNDCDTCDYGGKTGMFCIRMIDDVIAMLKEQEAVEPYSMNAERTYGICPKCGKIVFRYGNVEENHYCGVCGQAVKWK